MIELQVGKVHIRHQLYFDDDRIASGKSSHLLITVFDFDWIINNHHCSKQPLGDCFKQLRCVTENMADNEWCVETKLLILCDEEAVQNEPTEHLTLFYSLRLFSEFDFKFRNI